ncbi:potassium transport protein TRK1/TRK2 [Aspergillus costaricaensis CBS 115574]|uniref:Potassium transport protein TRK1/TRK2 n=1 Tax=Aspergillus costaricaensis CBS 115574 TaxID=1448317 RepID=A0ACD1IK48_9EURO|nr:potassium transport protein TRK1/TRK2 [Aspergillus costaricaensis CBS 115574]RAK90616.1 potassium transport protein TRK1/TRK2 [Aspergillus costaricaensis CBS 115574]
MFSAVLRRATSVTSRFTSHIPWLKNLRMNFVLIHYVYIIATALLSSVIIYPGANLDYTDALFLSAGAATQSGLNTVDLNTLHTYQQIVLYVVSMLTTPIFIHTVLVFVRLYWFEKRFQHVVSDARALRHTRSRLRTISEDKDGQSSSREEAGVAGRSIVVLRDTLGQPGSRQQAKEKSGEDSPPASPTARDPPENLGEDANNALNQKLAIGLGNSLGNLRVPAQLSPEHHIAFLENQRRNKGALRIPSPREYDNGGAPQVLEEEEEEETNRPVRTSSNSSSSERSPCDMSKEDENGKDEDDEDEDKDEDRPRRLDGPHITINEPDMIRTRTRNSTFPRLDTRPTFRETKNESDASQLGRLTSRRPTLHNLFRTLTQERERSTQPYLSWNATVGRNSNFVDLTEEQRDELGGIEYRALKTLAVVLISYYAFFHILGILCLVPWIMTTHWGKVVEEIGQGRPWWAIFMAQSAFNDVGFTLTPDSLSSFQKAIFPLLLMTFLIIIGNTGFPCMLRLIIWALSKVTRAETPLWEELRFLLDHPRRCFTLLFPRNATWWLFAILVALNGIDLIFFIILDLNDSVVTSLPTGIRIVDGLFQAACTRTAGLAVISVSDLHPAVQVSYLIMMYISVFPIAISLRRTNVYEEKSLGIYASTEDDESDENQTAPSYIGAHLRKQLSFDLWYVFLGLFIITIVEGKRLQQQDEYSFQVWSVLFEVVSAYGTVGLSLGYPGVNASFSSQFQVLSKLVIIAMQIRGRHRGLPYALDRAILLPSESLNQNEIADAERRMRRRTSSLSQMSMDRQQSQGRPEHGASTSLDPKDRASQTWNHGDIIRRQSTMRSQRSQR